MGNSSEAYEARHAEDERREVSQALRLRAVSSSDLGTIIGSVATAAVGIAGIIGTSYQASKSERAAASLTLRAERKDAYARMLRALHETEMAAAAVAEAEGPVPATEAQPETSSRLFRLSNEAFTVAEEIRILTTIRMGDLAKDAVSEAMTNDVIFGGSKDHLMAAMATDLSTMTTGRSWHMRSRRIIRDS
jgi:hypothetical protein